MPFHIRDPEVDAMVRELARRKGVGLTEAVKLSVRDALRTETGAVPLRDRLRKIAEPLSAYPDKAIADKAFFDDLSGD